RGERVTNENILGGRFQAGRQAGRRVGNGAADEMLPALWVDRFIIVLCDMNTIPKMTFQTVKLCGHGSGYSDFTVIDDPQGDDFEC
ncbi:MAG: hypothetical protein J6V72_05685, partial [Kiritimatiellae bacterium]|nr:hypothetical protein [Kiritimatiellia bacterium]